jgi:hypothetical protein
MKWISASNVCSALCCHSRRRCSHRRGAGERECEGGILGRAVYYVRTSQMKVTRSCHGAFLGSKVRAAVDAKTAMPATPARE